jgi:phage-related protein
MKYRTVIFYREYFEEFYYAQTNDVKTKITWTLRLIERIWKIPETYLKHIESTDGLYEIRVQFGSDTLRIFCFFDTGQVVVVLTGFHKKTAKTPKKEIKKALTLKQQYEKEK